MGEGDGIKAKAEERRTVSALVASMRCEKRLSKIICEAKISGVFGSFGYFFLFHRTLPKAWRMFGLVSSARLYLNFQFSTLSQYRCSSWRLLPCPPASPPPPLPLTGTALHPAAAASRGRRAVARAAAPSAAVSRRPGDTLAGLQGGQTGHEVSAG